MCEDCKGTGVYVGLNTVEECLTCKDQWNEEAYRGPVSLIVNSALGVCGTVDRMDDGYYIKITNEDCDLADDGPFDSIQDALDSLT